MASPEVIWHAYELIPRPPTCLVDDILDLRCQSFVVRHEGQPPLVVVNKVGLPRVALPTFLSFLCAHVHFMMAT